MEIKEHDVITYKGMTGTVIHIYPNDEAYVVEFIDSTGSSKIETLLKSQIEKEESFKNASSNIGLLDIE